MHFYPRSPCGERQAKAKANEDRHKFLSTLSLRRATIINCNSNFEQKFLSTLSLRRATNGHETTPCKAGISIHALLAESDGKPNALKSRRCVFLSTLSLRRATYANLRRHRGNHNFYPRSPCGERQPTAARNDKNNIFLSTLSLRRATSECPHTRRHDAISIHALLAESDDARRALGFVDPDISIHALLAESDTWVLQS